MSICGEKSDDEYSVIGDKGEVGFIDFEDDRSMCSYDPSEEGPVFISVPFSFIDQKPRSIFVDEVASESITIKNTTKESIELWGIRIYASNPEDSFNLSLMEPSDSGFVGTSSLDDRVLQPHKTLTVWLSIKPKNIGMHTCIVHFDIGDDRIERVVFLLAEDSVSKALVSRKPYQRRNRKTHFVVDSYVQGVRPPIARQRIPRKRLQVYEIPKEIREVIESKQVPDAILEGLSRKNYVSYFKALVNMEELRMEEDIKAYDMENATMRNKGRQFLMLEVLGLAERRPSLVHGDSVFASVTNIDVVYEGCIHRVEADHVYLKFADEFHQRHRDQNSYNIRFKYNRLNMRRMYQAIEAAEKVHKDFLFPSDSLKMRHIEPTVVVPISDNLNEEQLNAVEMILGCEGGVPYMINGPPGTGKTMTLVEVILQLYRTRKDCRILICASSNCAADHILEKILKGKDVNFKENEVFRLNASSRSIEDMKPEYMQYCFYEQNVFRCLPLEALLHFRIIISTYMSSAQLYTEGVRSGHFSHIILDEAGQASEPETMVPIANFCKEDTVVVLAGDPMQLGPVVFSQDAKKHGLGKSYLERLFECDRYCEGDEGYVTTLLRNYRSHPEILQLPSELFYNGELLACQEICKSTPWANLLPNKDFPILFMGIQAYDEREGDNPSWFNRTEASMVVKFIKKLIAKNVGEESIGVITPYRQQVAKIKKALDDDGLSDIKIGSVEQFQGQEREVVVISTVRSTVKHDEFDRVHYLGFLSNPKRFNVAITRARSLLVIVGNPHIICKDPFWAKLLWRCVDNNSYEGCSLPERQECHNEESPKQEGWSYAPAQERLNNGSYDYKGGSSVAKTNDFPADDGWTLDCPIQERQEWHNEIPKQEGWSYATAQRSSNNGSYDYRDSSAAKTNEFPADDGWTLDCPIRERQEWGNEESPKQEERSYAPAQESLNNGSNYYGGSSGAKTNEFPADDGWVLDAPVVEKKVRVAKAAVRGGKGVSWEDEFSKPVKDEDEWSDGWK